MREAGIDVTGLREPHHGFAHAVVPAASPRPWLRRDLPLAVTVPAGGRTMELAEFHDLTCTTAFVVVVDGVLVQEWYAPGVGPADRLLGWSATKSVLALLVGLAVDSGALAELDTPVTRWVPELTGSGWAAVSVRHLLTMTSGTRWLEDHRTDSSSSARLLRGFRTGKGGLRDVLVTVAAERPPGTAFAYSTGDSQVLDWVRERATGLTFPAALTPVWTALGAERPAVVGLDAPDGVAVAGGALAACARDWARIGALQIDGRWARHRVVSRDWVETTSRPWRPFLAPGRLPDTMTSLAGFGGHWWPLDTEGRRVTADGMRGQFVYVDRDLRTVVVKLSAWPHADPEADRRYRDLCYGALPVVARAAAAASA